MTKVFTTSQELDQTIEELKEMKVLSQDILNYISALEQKIKDYMTENFLTEEITPTAKITYLTQYRTSINKKALAADIGDISKYEKTTAYKVLRIS